MHVASKVVILTVGSLEIQNTLIICPHALRAEVPLMVSGPQALVGFGLPGNKTQVLVYRNGSALIKLKIYL